tara:strand:- start:4070 stop:4324 length:255 start_codon:yes stop_codon:yes gene_type:complete
MDGRKQIVQQLTKINEKLLQLKAEQEPYSLSDSAYYYVVTNEYSYKISLIYIDRKGGHEQYVLLLTLVNIGVNTGINLGNRQLV